MVAQKIRAALECEPPPPTMAARRICKEITAEHVIETQATIINEEFLEVDFLREKNKKLEAECVRLRKTCGWLRETQCPMGVA
jgi:hypothetical protein